MKSIFWALAATLGATAVLAAEGPGGPVSGPGGPAPGPEAAKPPQIKALLLEEAYRPEGAPARGETVWDLAEAAAYRLRRARRIFDDAQSGATPKGRGSPGWTPLHDQLDRVEGAYREAVWPGLEALARSLSRTRLMAGSIHLALREREVYRKKTAAGDLAGVVELDPDARKLLGSLGRLREEAFGSAVQAEEFLEKGVERAGKPGGGARIRDPHATEYLADLIQEAEDGVAKAASAGVGLAKAQSALVAQKGAYRRAVDGLAAYGGADGRGAYDETRRSAAVLASNEANRLLVVNEYALASRPEEARTVDYLLERLGKL